MEGQGERREGIKKGRERGESTFFLLKGERIYLREIKKGAGPPDPAYFAYLAYLALYCSMRANRGRISHRTVVCAQIGGRRKKKRQQNHDHHAIFGV